MDGRNTLDKASLKKYIIRSNSSGFILGGFWIAFVVLFAFVLQHSGTYLFAGMGAFLIIWNLCKSIKEWNAVKRDAFAFVEGIAVGEREDTLGDSNSYYITYWCGGEHGTPEISVPYKLYKNSRKGDRVYLLFLSGKPKLVFPKKFFELDAELRPYYKKIDTHAYEEWEARTRPTPKKRVNYQEKINQMTAAEKEEILTIGRKKGTLIRWMLLNIVIAFILFIVYLSAPNTWRLLYMLLFVGIFIGIICRILSFDKEYPEYDSFIYYWLKNDYTQKEVGKSRKVSEKTKKIKIRKPRKENRVMKIIRNILVVLIGAVCMLLLVFAVIDGRTDMMVIFGGGSIVSICMLVTRLRFLSILYPAVFFLSISLDAFLEDKKTDVGIIFLIMTLLLILPVLFANIGKQKTVYEKME